MDRYSGSRNRAVAPKMEIFVNQIIYIVGLIVVVLAVLSLVGVR